MASIVGLLLAAFYDPVWTVAIHTPRDFALALAALLLLQVERAADGTGIRGGGPRLASVFNPCCLPTLLPLPVAVFMAKNAVLSSFSTGRQTSLVVDAGHDRALGKRGSRPRA